MTGLIRRATVASTMDLLHTLASDGAAAGTVVVAEEQTGGRGSRGRGWVSPPGGLWLSVLFRPGVVGAAELCGLRIGLAVAEAIEALAPGAAVRIKWPNDLMLGERKLGGILCEARWQGEALAWVVAGVGVNVANPIPDAIGRIAIRLAERSPGVLPSMLEPEVIGRLRALDLTPARLGPDELSGLRRRDWLRGRRLLGPVAGTAVGIAEDGALAVAQDGDATIAVRAGTIQLADHSLTP